MKLLFFALLALLVNSFPVHADLYVSGKPLDSSDKDPRYSQLPPYLRYPNDALSAMMFKDGGKAWYSISTMKHESVIRNSVRSWVERADHLSFAMGLHDIGLRVPKPLREQEFKNVGMYYIEQNELYNELHGFDESHLYLRVFYLGGQLYKKFIIVAKKDDWSWRVEVNIPSKSEEVEPPDFVPAGQTFGKFYPVK